MNDPTPLAETDAMRVAVRELCEFSARAGDLDLRFGMAPSAREGVAGHRVVTSRRGTLYQSEVTLKGALDALTVSGRADGYDPSQHRLEEIKTFRGDLARQPANQRHLHWAQLKVYGWLLCERDSLEEITLALVYFNIDTGQEVPFEQRLSSNLLRDFFVEMCGRYSQWAQQERAHRASRDAYLSTLAFPHEEFRAGQRELAVAVFRAANAGASLLVEAPTGIGKSIATLFPVLKAMPLRKLDKVYFLSAKSSGRLLATDALALCTNASRLGTSVSPVAEPSHAVIRVVELVAKAKACLHPGQACTGSTCPLAAGFFDRLPTARTAWIQSDASDPRAVNAAARDHDVCPYYLAQELVIWADVVVADYNYYFDSSASLYSVMVEREWRVGVLVDEAHNLIERAREMYSAALKLSDVETLRHVAPALKRTWTRLIRAWKGLELTDAESYRVLSDIPTKFLKAMQKSSEEVGDYLAGHADAPAPLRDFYFATMHLLRQAESMDENSVCDLTCTTKCTARGDAELVLRNVIPAPYIGPRLAAADSAVLFSATLTPIDFYRGMLGVAEDATVLQVASPFDSTQLRVSVQRHISTRYRDRSASLSAISALMASTQANRPGNYLAFFSSFEYLQMAADDLRQSYPHLVQWRQTRDMTEADRHTFVQSFVPDGVGIGFAVLGGAFGEGVDLPGTKLIGAFIATLGLPPINPVNETYREVIERKFGNGYACTYTYPGIRKVVQASGRVIRTLSDEGTLHLMDDRFATRDVRRLLPPWWAVTVSRSSALAEHGHASIGNSTCFAGSSAR